MDFAIISVSYYHGMEFTFLALRSYWTMEYLEAFLIDTGPIQGVDHSHNWMKTRM
jgi:hypothetical protein